MVKANPHAKLGSGGRFKALEQKVEREGKSPTIAKEIAYSAGAKKYGAKKMHSMAAAGRRKINHA